MFVVYGATDGATDGVADGMACYWLALLFVVDGATDGVADAASLRYCPLSVAHAASLCPCAGVYGVACYLLVSSLFFR